MKNYIQFLCLVLTGLTLTANAQIQLPDLFSDHMVLQRASPLPVWGTASPAATVEVTFNQYKRKTQADYFGNWEIQLPAMPAGGPYVLSITSDRSTVAIKDIYIGEVWICSGQSNMEWSLRQSSEGADAIPQADLPLIRLFHLKKKHDTYKTPYTTDQLAAFSAGQFFEKVQWTLCQPSTAANFSGVAYFFGKTLQDSLQVPIGLIQAAVGGSPAQSWISKAALASHPQTRHLVDGTQPWLKSPIIHPWLAERAGQNWVNWSHNGTATLPGHPFAPHYLFDAAITPLAPYAIRGAIWYQGESNATHPASYPVMMELLLQSWRSLWSQGDFPFYYVQLPRIGNRNLWPQFRAAQQASLIHRNTGMVVTLDLGHSSDVHPPEKAVVGQRLAHLALDKTYHRELPAESPMLLTHHWDPAERSITLQFKNVYKGLRTISGTSVRGLYLQGYIQQGSREVILSPDRVQVAHDKIFLTYPADFLPFMVKYAWAPYPENNLVNSSGLPMAPFKINLKGLN